MMLRTLLLSVLLPVAAIAQVPKPNTFSDQLARLPDVPRRAALRRAILDSGERCKTVDRAGYQGPYRNLRMWRAHCNSGQDYGAFIGPDGSVQVRSCADLAALKLPLCRPWPKK